MLGLRGEQGKFGRLEPRPTAIGLLVSGRLEKGVFAVEWTQEFREPRHIRPYLDNGYLLTEINRLLWVDKGGKIIDSYTHPFFAFLHTVSLNSTRKKALVVSSGYDAVFEIDLQTKAETFHWFAWEHGFNPDEEGVWLAVSEENYSRYTKEGKKALKIGPSDYGEQGVLTARRSAHPNVGVYDSFEEEKSIVISIGHKGSLYRIGLSDEKTQLVSEFLSPMPHGLFRFEDGWVINDTTKGEWWQMDASFMPKHRYSFRTLGGKVSECGDAEWIQQVVPVGESLALALDANRGLIAIDLGKKRYTTYRPDENWCIQDALEVVS